MTEIYMRVLWLTIKKLEDARWFIVANFDDTDSIEMADALLQMQGKLHLFAARKKRQQGNFSEGAQ